MIMDSQRLLMEFENKIAKFIDRIPQNIVPVLLPILFKRIWSGFIALRLETLASNSTFKNNKVCLIYSDNG